jgi:oligoendopeptidase F
LAADLLLLISFFNQQGIPETLLRNRSEQGSSWLDQEESEHNESFDSNTNYSNDDADTASQLSVSNRFKDDVLALRNYLFISVNIDSTTFEMHGLVQLATREWLKAHEQQKRWKQHFIRNLDAKLPTRGYKNWARC